MRCLWAAEAIHQKAITDEMNQQIAEGRGYDVLFERIMKSYRGVNDGTGY
jgi:hypothetical protein